MRDRGEIWDPEETRTDGSKLGQRGVASENLGWGEPPACYVVWEKSLHLSGPVSFK